MVKDPKYGSDLIVDVLIKHNIEYVAFNPGSTIKGIHDSMLNYHNNIKPKLILCCHEEIAVAIAHGYAKSSNKCMAVLVHGNVGLMHASMAIFNAWCDRVPLLILGGVGPLDANKRRPWIDWLHTSNVQGNIVRDYVKWHDQPYSTEAVIESLHRALKITNTHPKAPVYLSIDTTLQDTKLKDTDLSFKYTALSLPPTSPRINAMELEKIMELLIHAKFPIIIADYLGKTTTAINNLVVLAELLGIGVIDCGGRFNFPSTHPLSLTAVGHEILIDSDLIIALDVQDLYGALGIVDQETGEYKAHINKEVKIVSVSMNDYLISSWAADYQKLYPVDISSLGDTDTFLSELYQISKENITSKMSTLFNERFQRIQELHIMHKNKWLKYVQENCKQFNTPTVIHGIWEVICKNEFVLTYSGGLEIRAWVKRLWGFDETRSFMGINSGGAGLGYGLGASIGAALHYKNSDKLCINLQSDGDMLFTPSALWTAAHYQVPLLIIVMNNRSYAITKKISDRVAKKRGRSTNQIDIGTTLTNPEVDFVQLAQSFGILTFPTITTLEELIEILPEAIKMVKSKQKPVLIDVVYEN